MLRYLVVVSAIGMMTTSCSRGGSGQHKTPTSELASVTLNRLAGVDYDYVDLKIRATNGSAEYDERFSGNKKINKTIKPGTYQFQLTYFKSQKEVYGTRFCNKLEHPNSYEKTLKPGANAITIVVCEPSGTPVDSEPSKQPESGGDASVAIQPAIKDQNDHQNPGVEQPSKDPNNGGSTDGSVTLEGQKLYGQQCAHCHGNSGEGIGSFPSLKLGTCTNCGNWNSLVTYIETNMPKGNVAQCDRACSEKVATYILNSLQ